ncbi:MAG: MFS transporter [Alphaproteobacteria bacterium]|nr:MAG: hypothetical protein B6I23_01775 [Rickettsiaceae bacterium 4572_127]
MSLEKNIILLKYIKALGGFMLYFTPALIFFIEKFGSNTAGMAIFSVIMISTSFLEIPTGFLSDKIGRVKVLQFGLVARIINLLLFCFGFMLSNYYLMIIGAIFNGLSMALNSGNNDALLFESVKQIGKEKKFTGISGKTNSLMFYSLGISTLLGTFLADIISFQFVLWISLIPYIFALIFANFLTEPKKHIVEDEKKFLSHIWSSFQKIWKTPKLRLMTCGNVFKFAFGQTAFQYLTVFYNTIIPIWAIGIFRSSESIFGGIGMRFAGFFSKRIKPLNIFLISLTASAFFGILAVSINAFFAVLLLLIPSFLYGVRTTVETTLFQKNFSDKQRATMGSVVSFLGTLAFGIVNILLGLIADYTGSIRLTLIIAIACGTFLALPFYLKALKE